MANKETAKKVGGKTEAPKVIAASKLSKEQALVELADLSKELDFQGADFTTMSLADLRKTVADGRKALKEAPAAPVAGTETPTAPAAETPAVPSEEPQDPGAGAPQAPVKGDSVDVIDGTVPNVRYIRTFSEEVHGEEFAALAQSFVSKHGGRIVASNTVKSVRVRWEEIERDAEGRMLNDGRMVAKSETFAVSSQEAKEDALGMAATRGGSVFVFEGKVK